MILARFRGRRNGFMDWLAAVSGARRLLEPGQVPGTDDDMPMKRLRKTVSG